MQFHAPHLFQQLHFGLTENAITEEFISLCSNKEFLRVLEIIKCHIQFSVELL